MAKFYLIKKSEKEALEKLTNLNAVFLGSRKGHTRTKNWINRASDENGFSTIEKLIEAHQGEDWGYLFGVRASQINGAKLHSDKIAAKDSFLGGWYVPYYSDGNPVER